MAAAHTAGFCWWMMPRRLPCRLRWFPNGLTIWSTPRGLIVCSIVGMNGSAVFAELNPPYSTIVADPPWDHSDGWPPGLWSSDSTRRHPLPYSVLDVSEIGALPVGRLAANDAHLYLWTTNRYLASAFEIARCWGFTPRQTLVWCKPLMGWQPGGAFGNSTEFVLFCRKGKLKTTGRENQSHWDWPRGAHSAKPAAFMDMVERVSPGPYVELFARAPRLGWDSWGYGYEEAA